MESSRLLRAQANTSIPANSFQQYVSAVIEYFNVTSGNASISGPAGTEFIVPELKVSEPASCACAGLGTFLHALPVPGCESTHQRQWTIFLLHAS